MRRSCLDMKRAPTESSGCGSNLKRRSLNLLRTVPHVAFEVDDLSAEIAGKEILIAPNSPSPGVTVAFIVENGAPVEFLQFDKK
jgi:hypothetical protein